MANAFPRREITGRSRSYTHIPLADVLCSAITIYHSTPQLPERTLNRNVLDVHGTGVTSKAPHPKVAPSTPATRVLESLLKNKKGTRHPEPPVCDANPTCVCAKSLQLCQTLCDSMDCSPPGSSVHGIFQARIHALLQGLFLTLGSNLRLLHWQVGATGNGHLGSLLTPH